MKIKVLNFIGTVILAYALSFVLGWPAVMVAAILTAIVFPLRKSAVFFVPFLAVFLSWLLQSFLLSSGNDFILAKRIALLLPLGGNPHVLILVSALIGGIAAGIVAIFGKQLQLLFKK